MSDAVPAAVLTSPPCVLVVGTGSVGRRHISNLLGLGARVLAYSYRAAERLTPGQADVQTAASLPAEVERVSDWSLALPRVQAVVVANRTDQHLAVATAAAKAGRALFIEKPLGIGMEGVADLQRLVAAQGLVVEAGFMLRTHPNLSWMRQALAQGCIGEVFHARAAVGQWLPDWRPGTDHRQGYGAFRATGGGVIFDLVHELDLVQWLLSPAVDVVALCRQVPALDIETEAVAQIGLRLSDAALAQVHLDYVRPGYGRHFEVVGRTGVLSWDYVQGTVTLERASGERQEVHRLPADFQRNDMFLRHMAHFLERVQGSGALPISPLDEAVSVLQVALAAHRSNLERRSIDPRTLTAESSPVPSPGGSVE
jgi:predicted dehydrogenase